MISRAGDLSERHILTYASLRHIGSTCRQKLAEDFLEWEMILHVYVTKVAKIYVQVPAADTYRGKYRDNKYGADKLTDLYVKEIEDVIELLKDEGRAPAAIIMESMQSCGGQVIYPSDYLRKVKRSV